MSEKKGRIGSSFEDFLKDEDRYAETTAVAVKRVLAWPLRQDCQWSSSAKPLGGVDRGVLIGGMRVPRSGTSQTGSH